MGGINVKNTIVERALQSLAPHYCYSCGKVGSVVCPHCKYDIIDEPFVGCFVCGAASREGICEVHNIPIKNAIIVSERSGVVEALINGLKFHNAKAVAKELALLLHERLPLLPDATVIVPIPTVRSHIRQRGYDQVDLIAQHLARLRGIQVKPILRRTNKATQHTLGREERHEAIKDAFALNTSVPVPSDAPILLLDDVITTGSTVIQAAQVLRSLDATIIVAAVAYQPLD